MTLVSGGIRFMRIFAEVRRQTTMGLSTTAIFSVIADYFSDTLNIRRALLYGVTQYVVGFSLVPNA